MHASNRIELDLLFRIDFRALTEFGEEGHTDVDVFESEKIELKKHFGFNRFFTRGEHEYVALSELLFDNRPYLKYLELLKCGDLGACCCQLEQAIGVLKDGELVAFLATDCGVCYNTKCHFSSVHEILINGESDQCAINTFYGKVEGKSVELLYSPTSYNIDISKDDIVNLSLGLEEFEAELKDLKIRINTVFRKFKVSLLLNSSWQNELKMIDQIFHELN